MYFHAFGSPPHLGSGRIIQKGQLIHESVLKYMKQNDRYMPAAQTKNMGLESWDQLKSMEESQSSEFIEPDVALTP